MFRRRALCNDIIACGVKKGKKKNGGKKEKDQEGKERNGRKKRKEREGKERKGERKREGKER